MIVIVESILVFAALDDPHDTRNPDAEPNSEGDEREHQACSDPSPIVVFDVPVSVMLR
jgi:hypothetical protein